MTIQAFSLYGAVGLCVNWLLLAMNNVFVVMTREVLGNLFTELWNWSLVCLSGLVLDLLFLCILSYFQELMKKFQSGPPLLDPVEDMGIKESELVEIVRV